MNLKLTYDKLKAANQGATITQGSIISEYQMTAATQNVNFAVTQTQKPNPSINDILLKQSDAFCVTAMSVQIRRVTQAGAVATAAEIADGPLYTFANPDVFVTTEAAAIRTIYNSTMQLVVNKKQIYTQIRGGLFEYVPNLQQGQVSAAIAGPVTYPVRRDAKKALVDGFFPLWPTINLSGAWDVNFQLNLPASVNMTAAGNFQNRLVLVLDGFLLQNSAQYTFPD